MFQFGYLFLVLFAALPLGRTFLTAQGGGSQVAFAHRLYRDLAYIAAAVLGIICFGTVMTISRQSYSLGEHGPRSRYWVLPGPNPRIFVAVLSSVGIFIGCNLRALCRPLPDVPA